MELCSGLLHHLSLIAFARVTPLLSAGFLTLVSAAVCRPRRSEFDLAFGLDSGACRDDCVRFRAYSPVGG